MRVENRLDSAIECLEHLLGLVLEPLLGDGRDVGPARDATSPGRSSPPRRAPARGVEDDLDLTADGFVVRGSPRRASRSAGSPGPRTGTPASLPADVETGFEASATFRFPGLEPPDPADRVNASGQYAFMVDVAVVEIDADTGRLAICDYVSVHDAGTILDPAIVEGQRRGGFAHGLGGALYEHVAYSADGMPRHRPSSTTPARPRPTCPP